MWRSDKTKIAVLTAFRTAEEVIVYDTETTGLNAQRDRVIQFSGIKFSIENNALKEKERIDVYINPEYPLPPKITEITGISDDMLVNAAKEPEVFPEIKKFFGEAPVICGHNVSFDNGFLTEMYTRNSETFSPSIILDTLEMSRDITKGEAGSNKLGDIARMYGVDSDLTFHNALDDVIACSRILFLFYKEYEARDSKENSNQEVYKNIAKPYKLRYWPGYRGRARIYVYTNFGDFYYDIMKKAWGKGTNNIYNLEQIDMEQLQKDAFKLAGANDEKEFARFRG